MLHLDNLTDVIFAIRIYEVEISGLALGYEYRSALARVTAIGQPGDHSGSHVVENLGRAKDGHITAEKMAVKAPDRVLGFRMPREFPHRFFDKIHVGEIIVIDFRLRNAACVAG